MSDSKHPMSAAPAAVDPRVADIGIVRRTQIVAPRLRNAARRLRKRKTVVVAFLTFCMFLWCAVFGDFLASPFPIFAHTQDSTYVLANVLPDAQLQSLSKDQVDARMQRGFAVRALLHVDAGHRTASRLTPPFTATAHPLGTDAEGRDVLACLLLGTRTVMTVAAGAVVLLVVVGATLGALSGFFGGTLDTVVTRAVEVMTAFPPLLLALLTQSMLQKPSASSLILSVALTRWAEVARLVRAEVLRADAQDYLLASRAMGASPVRTLWVHVFPNARAQAIVSAAFALSTVVLVEASCDFLGYGLQTTHPTWGQLMAQVRFHPSALWLLIFPGLLLLTLVLCQNIVGDALRDALDPHHHDELP